MTFKYVALTWGIPAEYGGMTKVLLNRSNYMARRLNQHVPLITLQPHTDISAQRRRLLAQGALAPVVQLRNPWYDLCRMSPEELAHFTSLATPSKRDVPISSPDVPAQVESHSDQGAEHYLRDDGSLVLRDARRSDKAAGITLYGHDGRPIAEWDSARALYFSWIDYIAGGDPTVVVCDSKFVSSFIHHYRRSNVRVISVFHNTHRSISATSASGPFTRSRAPILLNNEGHDGIAFLTTRQASDFSAAFDRRRAIFTIPNAADLPRTAIGAEAPRAPGHGMMAVRLVPEKRVQHAIEAVRIVRERGSSVELDVYGSGPESEGLSSLIEQSSLGDAVRLRGFDAAGAQHFARASFSLLTSTYEGMPLVLAEAMSRGCIPIAYDIRYGPADIITHGINGFLVSPGNILELADTIEEFLCLSEDDRLAMRHAAIQRAQEYTEDAVGAKWEQACETVLQQNQSWTRIGLGVTIQRVSISRGADGAHLELQGTIHSLFEQRVLPLRLLCISRNRRYAADAAIERTGGSGSPYFRASLPLSRLPAEGRTYDFWLAGFGPGSRLRLFAGNDARMATSEIQDAESGLPWVVRSYATVHGNLSLQFSPLEIFVDDAGENGGAFRGVEEAN